MAKSILYLSMSLDGFITGPGDGPGNGLGNGGHVPDAATAMREAKAAVGNQDVVVQGAGPCAVAAARGPCSTSRRST